MVAQTFWVETLGCPKNAVDSDKVVASLVADGLVGEWWDFGQQPPVRYQVELQDPNWVAVAAWDDPSQSFVALGSPITLDLAALGYLNLWSNSLGGQVSYVDGNTYLTFFAQEFVTGDDPVFGGVGASARRGAV